MFRIQLRLGTPTHCTKIVSRYNNSVQWYSGSLIRLEEETDRDALAKEAKREVHQRRVAYKKEVSMLRKKYASEVALQRAADLAAKTAKQREEARQALERRRLKNIKAAQSAIREMERRRQRELEFQEELRIAQENREARNERYRKARQLLIHELEAEAPLWMTTPEEVNAAFTHAAEQELWAYPNSVLGAPLPTEDAAFWNMETITWEMNRTYLNRREALEEELMEQVYLDSNIDKNYWTAERLEARKTIQDKAKLRAMVRHEGRKALLLKQHELLQDLFPRKKKGDPPRIQSRMPVPNVKLLANVDALEKEGVEVLLRDPRTFFEFDTPNEGEESKALTNSSTNDGEYSGPTLGIPRGLKSEKAFPKTIGLIPKPDTRTAKQKKRDEKAMAMMLAARNEEGFADQDDIDDDPQDEIDLDNIVYEDEDGWEVGLDPVKDKEILNLPPGWRYTDEDIDAVVERLKAKIRILDTQLGSEIKNTQERIEAAVQLGEMVDDGIYEEDGVDAKYSLDLGDKSYDIESLGLDPVEVDRLMSSLTQRQMLALYEINRKSGGSLDMETLRSKLAEVPDLTNDQIEAIIKVEQTLSSNETVRFEEEFKGLQAKANAIRGISESSKELDFGNIQAEFDEQDDIVSDEEITQLEAEFESTLDEKADFTMDSSSHDSGDDANADNNADDILEQEDGKRNESEKDAINDEGEGSNADVNRDGAVEKDDETKK